MVTNVPTLDIAEIIVDVATVPILEIPKPLTLLQL